MKLFIGCAVILAKVVAANPTNILRRNDVNKAETDKSRINSSLNEVCTVEFLSNVKLNRKYRVTEFLAEGGYASVFKANRGKKAMAVKCLTSTRDLAVCSETEFLKSLKHKNIIQLIDAFQAFGHQFIVTELCLLDLYKFNQFYQLNLFETKKVMQQIADALIYLHGEKIFHHDLKPENILVRDIAQLSIKVGDFGFATKDLLSTGFRVGNFQYLSPEIFNNQIGISWAMNDIWAAGVVMFNLLTHQDPWKDPNGAFGAVDTFQSKFGFNQPVMDVFQKVFNKRIEDRPSALEFKDLVSRL